MDTNSRSIPRYMKDAKCVTLRPPNISHQDVSPAAVSTINPQRTIMLSPNAPEFIPRKSNNDQIRTDNLTKNMNSLKISPIQNRLNKLQHTIQNQVPQNVINHELQQQPTLNQHDSTNNHYYNSGNSSSYNDTQNIPTSNNAINQNQNVSAQQDAASSQDNYDRAQEESYAINYIESIVNSLNENPGSFDSVAKQAQMLFEGFTDNFYVLSNAMEIIFIKSIEEQNFRYMGAKLYNLLDTINLNKESMFRNLLSFKLTYLKQEINNFIKNKGQHKVRGITLFLAELYMQLRDNGDTLHEIGQSIVFSIEQLLTNPSPENIKCVCLTLKLAGYDLEKDCRNNMNTILVMLSTIENMDVSTSRLLESVLKLKENFWGRTEEIQAKYSSNTTPYTNNYDEPVFYGPDGQILTEEESLFLASISNSDNLDDNDSEYEYNPEMDAETASAFKDFLKNNLKM